MKERKYSAFISYRKSSSENADLIKKALVENGRFDEDEIFLDKHDIGPELFHEKIEKSLINSSCVILLVTKDCFVPKTEGEDWFLKEIKTALDYKKTIIPILFDGIESLNESGIKEELSKSFKDDKVNTLQAFQAIPYNFDLSEATFDKLTSFVEKANKTPKKNTKRLKGCLMFLVGFLVVYALCFGIGVVWGYFTSSSEEDVVIEDNTTVVGSTIIFEFEGLKAVYDLEQDTIVIDLAKFDGTPQQSNWDFMVSLCSFPGSLALWEKSLSNFKYMKYLKNGSKPGKIATIGVAVVTAAGTFLGFAQGSKFGRCKKQQECALKLYPKLLDKKSWYSIVQKDFLLQMKWNRNNYSPKQEANVMDRCVIISPMDTVCVAYKNGLVNSCVLLRYNDWNIIDNSISELGLIIEKSRYWPKSVVYMEEDFEIMTMELPSGIAGIYFTDVEEPENKIKFIKNKYYLWDGGNRE